MKQGWLLVLIVMQVVVSGVSAATLQFTETKGLKDGTVQLRWSSEPTAVYRIDYRSALDNQNAWQTLMEDIPSHGTSTLFLDTGLYWSSPEIKHPRYDAHRFYRVVKIGNNTLPIPTVTITSPNNGSVLSGEVTITATVVTANRIDAIGFFVDGEEIHTATIPANGTASYTINTTEWPNGTHTIFAVARTSTGSESTGVASTLQTGAGTSAYRSVTFNNYIQRWEFSEAIFEPDQGEIQQITAQFSSYSSWVLTISDEFNTAVRSVSGVGTSMKFDWDGTGDGGVSLSDGQYQFSLVANETTPPPPAPPGGGGPPLPPLLQAAMAGQATYSVVMPPMPPVRVGKKFVPWEDVFGPVQPKEIPIPRGLLQRWNSTSKLLNGGAILLGVNGAGQTTQNPKRPAPKTVKGSPGTVGVAHQGHHPAPPVAGFSRPNNLTGLIVLDPVYQLPYDGIKHAKSIGNGFSSEMGKHGWKTLFNYRDDQLLASHLRKPSKGGSSLFNFCNIGLLVGHAIRGASQDFLASSTPSLQTYFPIYKTGVNSYDWVRLSECDFGGAPGKLRWMGIYACNILSYANALDMWNKGVLPMNQNLHILLGHETSVWMFDSTGKKWASFMNGTEGGGRRTVIDGWARASEIVHKEVQPGHDVISSCLYWPNCINDKLLSYTPNDSDDPSEIGFRRVRVWPTYSVLQ